MPSVISELRVRPLVGGVLSYLPWLYEWWDNRRPTGNTSSSAYSKGVWEFHRDNYCRYMHGQRPQAIAELGPGATLGTCIAALCDGIEQAVGLDLCPYAGSSRQNQQILDELWPTSQPSPRRQALVDAINRLGSPPPERPLLEYVAPWNSASALPEASVDMVFSHSVLEHVDHPAEAYAACFRWLRPGGLMSHKIDHSSHGITNSWNGHYAIPKWLWKLIRGGRPYLLNRFTPSDHRTRIRSAGFEILSECLLAATSGDPSTMCELALDGQDTRKDINVCVQET